ncbi:MAG TPA: TonB-dependent receptor [Bacteroidales bacterium]|nr:TonB-dependent receptor [Bacteroidales bacterium]
MLKKFIIFLSFFASCESAFSQKISISGYVTDSASGEILSGATIISSDHLNYAISNNYGYYFLNLNQSEDSVKLQVSFVGFTSSSFSVKPNQNQKINISLINRNTLEEVIVSAQRTITYERRKEMGVVSVPLSKVLAMPSIGGESDILKSLQLMPGIQSGNEASSGLYVRGGSPDQNLMVIDDVPMYYVNHLGGFVSTFNSDAINNMKLVKGGFPAHYGSRLSSVVDIKMKEGNMKEFHGSGMIGMIASKIMVEGPFKKETTSYMFSLRRFMYDLLTRPLTRLTSVSGAAMGYNFYDLNAKVNHIFSPKDRLYLCFYSGGDKILTTQKSHGDINKMNLEWGNILGSFRWNHLYNDKLFSNVTLYSTRYRLANDFSSTYSINDVKEKTSATYFSGIVDIAVKADFDNYINQNYKIKFGGNSIYHQFNPNTTSYKSFENNAAIDTSFGSKKQYGLENAAYLENEISIGTKLFTNLGFRVTNYRISNRSYNSFEPRFLATFMVGKNTLLKASYSSMNQYIHLLTGSGSSMQNDVWVPVTYAVKPSLSHQYSIGFEKTFKDEMYEVSLEGYHKNMKNLITYKDGVATLSSASDWQTQIETNGRGKSYGLEFLFKKTKGSTTGWIAYTYSKSTRQFENKNNGKPYPFKYDRTHDISIVYLQRIKSNVQFSATWVYGTGNPFTLAAQKYKMIPDVNTDINKYLIYGQAYTDLNSFRMRSYHKLDVGINFNKKVKRGERTWSINIYNLYNRQNPYYYFLDNTYQFDERGKVIPGATKTVLKQQSYFPIIPSFSYSLKF